jgi:hypothetical protein
MISGGAAGVNALAIARLTARDFARDAQAFEVDG